MVGREDVVGMWVRKAGRVQDSKLWGPGCYFRELCYMGMEVGNII